MKQKVLVVTHDAGGSEIIAAYIKANRTRAEFRVYTNGPGARVFRRLGIPFRRVHDSRTDIRKIIGQHTDCTLALLALPGWMTHIELMALEEAKKAGIRTAIYLEDWSKYRARLGETKRSWQKRLPDELWAGDAEALKIARKEFDSLPVIVRFKPNEYFRGVVARFRALRKTYASRHILFLSSAWGTDAAFADLLKLLADNDIKTRVRIRFHPADDRTRYASHIRRYRGQVSVEVSKEKDLARELAQAGIVIGNRTVALVLAALCHLPAVDIYSRPRPPHAGSLRPRWALSPTPRLTFPGVTHAKSVREVLPLMRRSLGIATRQRATKRV